jgi:hypothetical protein
LNVSLFKHYRTAIVVNLSTVLTFLLDNIGYSIVPSGNAEQLSGMATTKSVLASIIVDGVFEGHPAAPAWERPDRSQIERVRHELFVLEA